MAKQDLPREALLVSKAVEAALPPGDIVVGCSGGADSTALALGAQWASRRRRTHLTAVIVDHGLQPDSDEVAKATHARLSARGIDAVVVRVEVRPDGDGIEAAARDARLHALAQPGLPVLLGHSLDDQAESVLLGLLRGSGTRSVAGMAPVRGQFFRPLLGLRRAQLEHACVAWGVQWWDDPMNTDPAYARVRARVALRQLSSQLGRDLAPALARTASLARADNVLLEQLAADAYPPGDPECRALATQPEALRWRIIHRWLTEHGSAAQHVHVLEVDRLLTAWHGQGPVTVPGGQVARRQDRLVFVEGAGRFSPR